MPSLLIENIARPAVRLGLSASRLPVDAAAQLLGEAGNEEWPPALVLDGLQATVLQATGSLLHDDQLSAQGRLLAEKVDRLRAAATLEAEAAVRSQEADEEREAARAEAEQRRHQAAEAAQEKKELAARRAAERKQKARQAAAAEADAAREAQQRAEQRTERQERQARTAAIATEREAVTKEKAAVKAAANAAQADAQIQAVKDAPTN